MPQSTARSLTLPSETSPAEESPQLAAPPVVWRLGLAAFASISLAEMDAVALLDRRDTKYVLPPAALAEVLDELRDDYRVLEIDGARAHAYRTIYFDTPAFGLYLDHHRGRPQRYKIRSREYCRSGTAYFELKRKDKRDRTTKVRLQTPGLVRTVSRPEEEFLAEHHPADLPLLRSLQNDFHRVTLVSTSREERVTLDVGLRFNANGKVTVLPGVAIAEVKSNGPLHDSDFVRAMRRHDYHAAPFSKYCVGVALHYDHLKHNRFSAQLRLVNRLMGATTDVC